jgi:hypothetical protein
MLDDGGIVIFRAEARLWTRWYEPRGLVRGYPLPTFGKAEVDRSYRRVGQDSDNNLADFVMGHPSTPTNPEDRAILIAAKVLPELEQ